MGIYISTGFLCRSSSESHIWNTGSSRDIFMLTSAVTFSKPLDYQIHFCNEHFYCCKFTDETNVLFVYETNILLCIFIHIVIYYYDNHGHVLLERCPYFSGPQ